MTNSKSRSRAARPAPPDRATDLRGPGLSQDDARLIEALKARDEGAFAALIDRHSQALLSIISMYVNDRLVAQEVLQETWIGVLEGLHRFEGRSSLKTWVFRIAINIARKRRSREARSVPFSALNHGTFEPSVDPNRFRDADDRLPGHWKSPPPSWDTVPEERLLSAETLERVREALDALPPAQRSVMVLRDVEGWTSEEICNLLGITGTNQRVLLHRARSKVRRGLETYLESD